MKRRGFLAFLGLSSAVPAAALASRQSEKQALGFEWRTFCKNQSCGSALNQYIDLSKPLVVGTQCPHCLWTIDTSELADSIPKYMRENSVWNGYWRSK